MFQSVVRLQNLTTGIGRVNPADLFYKMCFKCRGFQLPGSIDCEMFGRPIRMTFVPHLDGSFAWLEEPGSRLVLTSTDNKYYTFFHMCWGNGFASFGVISTVPVLPARKRAEIWAHAKKLGFKEENFVYLRYDYCKKRC